MLCFVSVPPRIEDSLTSSDKVKTEGSNVTLECSAHGSPKPTVTWKREDGVNISIDKARNISGKNIICILSRRDSSVIHESLNFDHAFLAYCEGNGDKNLVTHDLEQNSFPPAKNVPKYSIMCVSVHFDKGSFTTSCIVE